MGTDQPLAQSPAVEHKEISDDALDLQVVGGVRTVGAREPDELIVKKSARCKAVCVCVRARAHACLDARLDVCVDVCVCARACGYEDHCTRVYVCARACSGALARVAQGAKANAGAQDALCVHACKSVGYACVRGRR